MIGENMGVFSEAIKDTGLVMEIREIRKKTSQALKNETTPLKTEASNEFVAPIDQALEEFFKLIGTRQKV